MFAFSDVPTVGAMLHASFVNAVQLRLRLPLSLLAGITTMACKCGCAMGPFGGHVLSCPSCLCDRTPGNDLVVDVKVLRRKLALEIPRSKMFL